MDISDICSICAQSNDDMLMLTCMHNPCINCAASAYAELVHIKNADPNIYICEKCGEETDLDGSTVRELGGLAKSYVKMPTQGKASQSKLVGRIGGGEQAGDGSPRGAARKPNSMCKIHSEEELTYYCFGCLENICPECAIHGSHKDHDVKLIKKAVAEVKSQYLGAISKAALGQNQLAKCMEGFEKAIKQSREANLKEKAMIAQQFEVLRNALINKQREILKEIDTQHKQNVASLSIFVAEISKVYEQIQKNKKLDVQVFEYYRNLPKIEAEVEELRGKGEAISAESASLDVLKLERQLTQTNEAIKKIKIQSKTQTIGGPKVAARELSDSIP